MDPPSADMMIDTVILHFAGMPTGAAGDAQRSYAEPGITLVANVSGVSTVPAEIAQRPTAMLRATVMVYEDPDGQDPDKPDGIMRRLCKGDGVTWQGRLLVACGPMTPESKAMDGAPVNYKLEIETSA